MADDAPPSPSASASANANANANAAPPPSPRTFLHTPTPAQRTPHGIPASAYLLPADEFESLRLDFQHAFLRRCLAGEAGAQPTPLLAGVPLRLEDLRGAALLDAGTGTGIWLREVGASLRRAGVRDVRLVGVDMTDRQFPRRGGKESDADPAHLELRTASVCALPAEWTARFALVHQRLLIAALTVAEWGACAREVFRVLRPGGWALLAEVGNVSFGGALGADFTQMGRALFRAKGLAWDLEELLPGLLREVGFESVSVRRLGLPLSERHHGADGRDGAANFIEVYRGVREAFVKVHGERFGGDPAAYDALLAGMKDEWDTRGERLPFLIITARKPPL